MSDIPMIDEENSNYVMLPYTLTKGVTATREGLAINLDYAYRLLVVLGVEAITAPYDAGLDARVLPWPDAAESLRYRKGDPWCTETLAGSIICPKRRADTDVERALPRLAAILCDDAEGFRVLHWCVSNLEARNE